MGSGHSYWQATESDRPLDRYEYIQFEILKIKLGEGQFNLNE